MANDKSSKRGSPAIVSMSATPITQSKGGIVTIPELRKATALILIVGTSPLVAHQFSAKMRAMILDKHKGAASAGREAKDPEANFNAARYRLSDGSDGMPASAFKSAIVTGASGRDTGITKAKSRGIFVIADDPATNLVRILSPNPPRMNEGVVRNATGVIDIRHRPEYWPWGALLQLEYLPEEVSLPRLMRGVQMAGHRIGIGEGRPGSPKSVSMQLGRFGIATAEQVEAFEGGELFASPTEPPRNRKVA